MLSVNCSKCGNEMFFNESNGTFICNDCSAKISVTDIDLPQLGSRRNSVYHADKAASNVFEVDDTIQQDNTVIDEDESMIINNSINEDEATVIYKKWSRHGIFSPHKINSSFKHSGLKLKYIPAFLYNVTGYGALTATTTHFSESVSRKERVSTTDYYSIERNIELHYGNLAVFEPEYHFMNSINDYNYNEFYIIKNDDLPENIVSSYSDEPLPISDTVTYEISNNISLELDNITKEYDSSYLEKSESDISFVPLGRIFVPVWHFSYGKTGKHEIYINARTGSVYGSPIISKFKTILTVGIPVLILSIILSLLFLSPQISKAADNLSASVSKNIPVIDDRADLFSDYEEISILEKAKKQRDQTGYQYIFVTSDNLERGTITDELEYVYNSCRDDISSNGVILFLIYSNNGSYECELQGYTKARDYIPPETCDNIEYRLSEYDAKAMIEHLFDYLSEVTAGSYINAETSENNKTYTVAFLILIILSCIIATGALTLLYIPRKSVMSDYSLAKPKLHITLKKDTYIRTQENIYKH